MRSALDEILRHPAVWCMGQLPPPGRPGIPTGCDALDRELPERGWPVGALTELLVSHRGVGELSLLMPALRRLSEEGKTIALLAPPLAPHACAWGACGVRLDNLIVIEAGDADLLWAAEQALRSGACAMAIVWSQRDERVFDYRALRRLQLAADRGGAACLLYRPPHAAASASPAPLRLALAAGEGELAVNIFKRRGAALVVPVRISPFPAHWRKRYGTQAALCAGQAEGAGKPARRNFPGNTVPSARS